MKGLVFYLLGLLIINFAACKNTSRESIDQQEKIDNQLKAQLADYWDALNRGDKTKVSNYLYPALIEWVEINFNDDDELTTELFIDQFVDVMQKTKRYAEQNNYDHGITLEGITKRITYEEQLVYLIDMCIYIRKDDVSQEMHSVILCFSEDKGETWKFIEKEEGVDEILAGRFPRYVIRKILN